MTQPDNGLSQGQTPLPSSGQYPNANSVIEPLSGTRPWYRRALIVGGFALAGVLVVGSILTAGVSGGTANGGASSNAAGEVTHDGASSGKEAGERYFAAVVAGDAETAKALLSLTPENSEMLTDEALAAASQLAPITQVAVTETSVSELTSSLNVSYLLGAERVTAEITAQADKSKGWLLSSGATSTADLEHPGSPVWSLNGTPLQFSDPALFPGAYTLDLTHEYFQLGAPTTLTTTEPYLHASDIEVTLTPVGAERARSLIEASLDACLASVNLNSGCGIDVTATLDDGTQVVEGSVSRSLDGTEAATLAADPLRASSAKFGEVSSTTYVKVAISATCVSGGTTGTCQIGRSLFGGPMTSDAAVSGATVNLLDVSPVVTWT